VGDRVHVNGPGLFAEYFVGPSENCSPILQADLSFEDAASHFVNPATVYYMGVLAEKGGHKAAIHNAGASALGRMLIRYFKHKGIKLINIVRKDEYIEVLKNEEGADYVLNSQSPDFEKQLKEVVEKENATISFDALAGDSTAKLLKAHPKGSTCYVYGLLSGDVVNGISVMDLISQKTVTGLYIVDYIVELGPQGVGKFFDEIHSLLPTVFKTKIQKVFKLEQFKEAIEFYHINSSKGKILLTPN